MLVLIKALVEPPACMLALAALGLAVRPWRKKLGSGITIAALVALWLASTPCISQPLLRTLERDIAPLYPKQLAKPDVSGPGAIVVLSAGFDENAPQYGGSTVDEVTLERVRYGAFLHRATKLDLLMSGGLPPNGGVSVAGRMKELAESEFGVRVRWTEDRSNTTAENAKFSAEILQSNGIGRIYLVTNAWHLPRAVRVFARHGIESIAAPATFTAPVRLELRSFLPNASSLQDCRFAVHEWIGRLYYWLTNA